MQKFVDDGQFREDLYFRLNVAPLDIPALRDRPADIPTLAQFFIDKYAEVNGVPSKKISAEAQDKILSSKWRGNVRELENAMHRAILISVEPEIEADAVHLSDTPAPVEEKTESEGGTLAGMEKTMILNTLDQCLGNQGQAAKILGISIRILQQKLDGYDLKDVG